MKINQISFNFLSKLASELIKTPILWNFECFIVALMFSEKSWFSFIWKFYHHNSWILNKAFSIISFVYWSIRNFNRMLSKLKSRLEWNSKCSLVKSNIERFLFNLTCHLILRKFNRGIGISSVYQIKEILLENCKGFGLFVKIWRNETM